MTTAKYRTILALLPTLKRKIGAGRRKNPGALIAGGSLETPR